MPEITTPYIPQYITVHLDAPSVPAENVTVSFPDYIKNVASSEIYPTWNESALRSNIFAQISYALNRVYTNFYRLQGYNFDITSSTAFDQKFINNRNIFSNISELVDEIFNTYIRREGFIEPLAAKFCNGTTVTCEGLSQWGSQGLAEQGYNSVDILKYYYGNNIELVRSSQIRNIRTQYPNYPISRGDSGRYVQIIQTELNRISQNYPSIPKVYPVDGIFGENTENSVKEFQRVFNLTPDGIVGEATWNRLAFLYVAVAKLSELESQGINYINTSANYTPPRVRADVGVDIGLLQYMINVIAEFDDFVPSIEASGVYDDATKNAVMQFQREYSLSPTGIINEETWDLLYRVFIQTYNIILSDNELFPVSTLPDRGTDYTLMASGNDVRTMQEYLNQIFSDTYGMRPIGTPGIYGRQTEQAVYRYQTDNGLNSTGTVDRETYNAITNTYKDIMSSKTSRKRQYPGFVLKEGQTDDNIRGNGNGR